MKRLMKVLLIVMVAGILIAPALRPALAGSGPGNWSMYGADPSGSRYNADEKKLGTSNVAGLTELWSFPTATVVTGTPVVADNMVFAAETGNLLFGGTVSGTVYALMADTGAVVWQTTLPGSSLTATATVMRGRVVIGDQLTGKIYGLNETNGKLIWTIRPNITGKPAIWGSGTPVGKYLAIGVASNEELFPTTVFQSRGSVVLLDPQDGSVLWQTYMIDDADYANGVNGVSVWTTPAYDSETDTLFVGTGNNFSPPTNATSDAMIALDASTGAIKWVNQLYPNDSWNPFPGGQLGPDFDIGDSPQIYRLPNGRKVVGAGQKSGVYHVLDPETGVAINSTGLTNGSIQGGLFADSAVVNGVVYANANSYPGGSGSALLAFSADNNGSPTVLWKFFPGSAWSVSGVGVANGVVYFTSAFDPNLYALDAATGQVLNAVPIGESNSGPSIAKGRVYVGTGNVLTYSIGPGRIVCLGVN